MLAMLAKSHLTIWGYMCLAISKKLSSGWMYAAAIPWIAFLRWKDSYLYTDLFKEHEKKSTWIQIKVYKILFVSIGSEAKLSRTCHTHSYTPIDLARQSVVRDNVINHFVYYDSIKQFYPNSESPCEWSSKVFRALKEKLSSCTFLGFSVFTTLCKLVQDSLLRSFLGPVVNPNRWDLWKSSVLCQTSKIPHIFTKLVHSKFNLVKKFENKLMKWLLARVQTFHSINFVALLISFLHLTHSV